MSVSPLRTPDDGTLAYAIELAAQAAERGLAEETCDQQARLACEQAKARSDRLAAESGGEKAAELSRFALRHREWRKSGALIFAGLLLLAILFMPAHAGRVTMLVPLLTLVAFTVRTCLR